MERIVHVCNGDTTADLLSLAELPGEIRVWADALDQGPLLPVADAEHYKQRSEFWGTRGFREAEFVLRQLAQETGGRAFFAQRAEELASVYGQIAEELSSQYTIGYAPKNTARDGSWRRILVQVDRPNATARTRRGYYAPAR